MKNIHILATEKPSKIYKNEIGELGFIKSLNQDGFCSNQNIYITNDEKIKERDWYFYKCGTNGIVDKATKTYKTLNKKYCKKIILTTDQDLIKDGVQAINDVINDELIKHKNIKIKK